MYEPATITDEDVDATEFDIRNIDRGFSFPRDNAVATAKSHVSQLRRYSAHTIADSTESDWVVNTFVSVGMGPLLDNEPSEACPVFTVIPGEIKAFPAEWNHNYILHAQVKQPEGSLGSTSAERWIAQLRAWIATHTPLPFEADDSRESIY